MPEASKKLKDVSYRIDGKSYQQADYLKNQSVTGLLVLKDGKIAYEYYGQGNTQQALWASRSVATSVVSLLVGVAVKERKIKSLGDKINAYVPDSRAPSGRT